MLAYEVFRIPCRYRLPITPSTFVSAEPGPATDVSTLGRTSLSTYRCTPTAGLTGSAVGTPDLHVLNGTGRPVHRGDVVVLVTSGRFAQPAQDFARTQRLYLVDRTTLAA